MPWYRWKDPSREGQETEIRTTSGRVVRGRIVSHGVQTADGPPVDLTGRDVQTTIIDDAGRFYTGAEVAPPATPRLAAA